jgi:hypothetical protein
MLPDVLSVIARALSFVCALQAAGAALFLELFGGQGEEVGRRIRRLGTLSAWAAMALVAVHYGLEPARMAGNLAGVWDLSLQELTARSSIAVAAVLRIVGLLLIVVGLKSGRSGAGGLAGTSAPYSAEVRAAGFERHTEQPLRPRTPAPTRRAIAWLGVALIAGSFAATGHTAAAEAHRWLLAGLLTLHLLVIEFWFGALLPLVFIARAGSLDAAHTVRRFSRIATALVPLILVAGVGSAWLLVPGWQVLREPYGQLLLLKVVGFAALLAIAALNKWRLGPELETAHFDAARRFRRSVLSEYVLIGAVLTITAVMTSFFSPEP